jgi:hypothetical protein
MRSARKLGSDRDQRVALAFWHARQVFKLLLQIGELEDKKDPDTDYRPALFAGWELVAHGLDKNFALSDETCEFLLESLDRDLFDEAWTHTRSRGRNSNDNEIRNRWIAGTVNLIVDKCGLYRRVKSSRSPKSPFTS